MTLQAHFQDVQDILLAEGDKGAVKVGGYWDSFLDMLDKAVTEGFLSPEVRNALIVEDNPEILLGRMEKEETSLPDKLK